MNQRFRPGSTVLALIAAAIAADLASAEELTVLSTEPTPRTITAPTGASITVHFDRPVDRASVGEESFWAFGRWSGTAEGQLEFSDDDHSVTLIPDHPFSAGELVLVVLSHDLAGSDGTVLRAAGYCFQFWTAARSAPRQFSEIDELSTNASALESSRPYGGIGSDLNGDGWLDVTVVNEDSADLRVFLNSADGTGLLEDFLQPTFPVNQQASPSEPADFNHDGVVDICVANISTSSVSVLLGNGDGSFGPQQEIMVGAQPRGIAALDADGDGDLDIVNTNNGSSNLSVLLNDGAGIFGPPLFFEGGGSGEWALAAADMNEDGILDLVVGARSSQQILISLGNGDGTFTHVSSRPAGGLTWMVAVGDLNGDGAEDVVTANSGTNNGAVLLGDGAGDLGAAQTYSTDPFPLATDLGDLDGDGDLDWMTSSFSGDWRLFVNEGDGSFAFDQEFDAPSNASCAVLLDLDNDRDLDLALIDEIADVIVLRRNGDTAALADVNLDGAVDVEDLLAVILAWGTCPPSAPCAADVNGDGTVSVPDLLDVIVGWTG